MFRPKQKLTECHNMQLILGSAPDEASSAETPTFTIPAPPAVPYVDWSDKTSLENLDKRLDLRGLVRKPDTPPSVHLLQLQGGNSLPSSQPGASSSFLSDSMQIATASGGVKTKNAFDAETAVAQRIKQIQDLGRSGNSKAVEEEKKRQQKAKDLTEKIRISVTKQGKSITNHVNTSQLTAELYTISDPSKGRPRTSSEDTPSVTIIGEKRSDEGGKLSYLLLIPANIEMEAMLCACACLINHDLITIHVLNSIMVVSPRETLPTSYVDTIINDIVGGVNTGSLRALLDSTPVNSAGGGTTSDSDGRTTRPEFTPLVSAMRDQFPSNDQYWASVNLDTSHFISVDECHKAVLHQLGKAVEEQFTRRGMTIAAAIADAQVENEKTAEMFQDQVETARQVSPGSHRHAIEEVNKETVENFCHIVLPHIKNAGKTFVALFGAAVEKITNFATELQAAEKHDKEEREREEERRLREDEERMRLEEIEEIERIRQIDEHKRIAEMEARDALGQRLVYAFIGAYEEQSMKIIADLNEQAMPQEEIVKALAEHLLTQLDLEQARETETGWVFDVYEGKKTGDVGGTDSQPADQNIEQVSETAQKTSADSGPQTTAQEQPRTVAHSGRTDVQHRSRENSHERRHSSRSRREGGARRSRSPARRSRSPAYAHRRWGNQYVCT
jgi:hypothetical protein